MTSYTIVNIVEEEPKKGISRTMIATDEKAYVEMRGTLEKEGYEIAYSRTVWDETLEHLDDIVKVLFWRKPL